MMRNRRKTTNARVAPEASSLAEEGVSSNIVQQCRVMYVLLLRSVVATGNPLAAVKDEMMYDVAYPLPSSCEVMVVMLIEICR